MPEGRRGLEYGVVLEDGVVFARRVAKPWNYKDSKDALETFQSKRKIVNKSAARKYFTFGERKSGLE